MEDLSRCIASDERHPKTPRRRNCFSPRRNEFKGDANLVNTGGGWPGEALFGRDAQAGRLPLGDITHKAAHK